jgi:hypothetical protein
MIVGSTNKHLDIFGYRLIHKRQYTMNEHKRVLPSLHETRGKGQLYVTDKKLIDVDFDFEQLHDGTLILKCTIPSEFAWSNAGTDAFRGSGGKFSFVGLAEDNWSIKIEKMMMNQMQIGPISTIRFLCFEVELKLEKDKIQNADFQPFLIRIPLANCHFSGSTTNEHRFKNGFHLVGQQLPFVLGELEVSLCYRLVTPNVIEILKNERTVGVISDLYIPTTSQPNLADLKEMLAIICSILTFAYDTRINWLGYEIADSNNVTFYKYLIRANVSDFYGDEAGSSWSPIPWILESSTMESFIQNAYSKYDQLWNDWDLYGLINIFTELRVQNRYMEVTGLHFSACSEILFNSYRRRTKQICKFEKALKNICEEVGFDLDEKYVERFAKDRHALVHEGIFEISDGQIPPEKRSVLPPREKWAWYDTKGEERNRELHFMEDFIGTVILNMLGVKKKLNGW